MTQGDTSGANLFVGRSRVGTRNGTYGMAVACVLLVVGVTIWAYSALPDSSSVMAAAIAVVGLMVAALLRLHELRREREHAAARDFGVSVSRSLAALHRFLIAIPNNDSGSHTPDGKALENLQTLKDELVTAVDAAIEAWAQVSPSIDRHPGAARDAKETCQGLMRISAVSEDIAVKSELHTSECKVVLWAFRRVVIDTRHDFYRKLGYGGDWLQERDAHDDKARKAYQAFARTLSTGAFAAFQQEHEEADSALPGLTHPTGAALAWLQDQITQRLGPAQAG